MDVTFVLEESGVTATVEVPCEADVAAAKEVACTALAVSPASVEMRIGTQVLEGTCRLQDTAFDAGVQVVLACRFADIKCPAEYTAEVPTTAGQGMHVSHLSLSPCGALCLCAQEASTVTYVAGLDTETFSRAFNFKVDIEVCGAPAISECKTRCYLACMDGLREVALPGGEVLRKVDPSRQVIACGGVVVSRGHNVVSVYDEDLTLLRSISHENCFTMGVSHCGGWVITSSYSEKTVRLWDVNTGEAVACTPPDEQHVARRNTALSRSASVLAVEYYDTVQLYKRSGAALRSLGSFEEEDCSVCAVQFTPCGKYVVVGFERGAASSFCKEYTLHQYDVATMSCVRVMPQSSASYYIPSIAISPCSRVVMVIQSDDVIVTRHLYPHNSE